VENGSPRASRDGEGGAAFSLRESVDLLGVPFPALVVAHPESFPWGQAEHPGLALVGVGVHVEHGLTGLGQRVELRQRGVHLAGRNEPVSR
jgi:hypothetical protein